MANHELCLAHNSFYHNNYFLRAPPLNIAFVVEPFLHGNLCTYYTYSCLIGKLIILGINILLCVTKFTLWLDFLCSVQINVWHFQLDGDLELEHECSWEDFLGGFRSKCLLMDWILQGFQTTVLVTNNNEKIP